MSFVKRHQLIAYFVCAYTASAIGLAVIGLPRLGPGGTQNPASLAIFPVLILSVAAASVGLTALTRGRAGIGELWSRMRRVRIDPRLYLVLLVPPAAILLTLTVLKVTVSPSFAPGWQLFGLPIGLVAGFFEEIGWTGFAYPRLRASLGAVGGAVLLGVLWGIWHMPVIDSLGAASPHGAAWPAYFAAFVVLVTAVRCLICWAYERTGSVALAQLIHASFTGTLILFSAPHVTPAQEATWYFAYAGLMWVGLIAAKVAIDLGSKRSRPREPEYS